MNCRNANRSSACFARNCAAVTGCFFSVDGGGATPCGRCGFWGWRRCEGVGPRRTRGADFGVLDNSALGVRLVALV